MPVSDYRQISEVLHMVVQIRPKRILDVGIGFGKWGVLCREVLDISGGRLRPDDWQTTIEGIEIFQQYQNKIWEFAYDNVQIGNALQLIDTAARYDLILVCDVLEHFDKRTGEAFLDKLLHHADIVIVTSPRGFVAQGAEFGNVHETHRSGWSQRDFVHLPHLYRDNAGGFMAIVALDSDHLRRLRLRFSPLDQLGVKWGSREFAKLLINRVRERLEKGKPILHRP
jgi:hypothetical protein